MYSYVQINVQFLVLSYNSVAETRNVKLDPSVMIRNLHPKVEVQGIQYLIVSYKNVDKNIGAARNALFSFLGNIFSYKCKISTAVQYHTWLVYIKPVLRSGLAALPVRTVVLKSLTKFHHKVLRSILKLSSFSPIAPLYFLLGELPMEYPVSLEHLVEPEYKGF